MDAGACWRLRSARLSKGLRRAVTDQGEMTSMAPPPLPSRSIRRSRRRPSQTQRTLTSPSPSRSKTPGTSQTRTDQDSGSEKIEKPGGSGPLPAMARSGSTSPGDSRSTWTRGRCWRTCTTCRRWPAAPCAKRCPARCETSAPRCTMCRLPAPVLRRDRPRCLPGRPDRQQQRRRRHRRVPQWRRPRVRRRRRRHPLTTTCKRPVVQPGGHWNKGRRARRSSSGERTAGLCLRRRMRLRTFRLMKPRMMRVMPRCPK